MQTQNNSITVHICNTVDCEIAVEFFVYYVGLVA